MRNTIFFTLTITFLFTACFLFGCSPKTMLYGKQIAEKETTLIGDILAHPAQFEGKNLKINGKIVQECPAGCWFMLRDDSGTIYVDIHPSNLAIPQVSGHKAVVSGVIKKEGLKVSFIGSGVEV